MGIKVKVGDPAPDFELESSIGSKIRLKGLLARNVVLYFYPRDDTPGCTKEACSFRDHLAEYRNLGAEVLGVSVDSLESHRKFAAKYDLPFPLLSDKEKKVAKAYGVLKPGGIVASRVTFVIDKNGRVAEIFPKVDVSKHSEQVVAALRKLS